MEAIADSTAKSMKNAMSHRYTYLLPLRSVIYPTKTPPNIMPKIVEPRRSVISVEVRENWGCNMRIATDIMDMSYPSRKLPPDDKAVILRCTFFNLLSSNASNTYSHGEESLILLVYIFCKIYSRYDNLIILLC